jgi:hypothetical protein
VNATKLFKLKKGFDNVKNKTYNEMTQIERKQRIPKQIKKLIFKYQPSTNNEDGA